jgi:hypothetical protein
MDQKVAKQQMGEDKSDTSRAVGKRDSAGLT